MYKSLNDCEILTEFPLKENNESFSYFHGIKSNEMYYSKCYHCERINFKLYLRKKKLKSFIDNMRFKLKNLNIE